MPHPNEDPLVTSSRREALAAMVFFLAAMAYTLTYCGINGYNRDPASIQLVFGFPDWVFYGVLVPWVVCTCVSVIYALAFMTDEPLGEAAENWNPEGADPLPTKEQSHA